MTATTPVTTAAPVSTASVTSVTGAVLDAAIMPTPVGPLSMLVCADGLCGMGFSDDPETLRRRLVNPGPLRMHRDLGQVSTVVRAYLAGDLTAVDELPVAPVAQVGGAFLRQVWQALRTVPPGRPVTYSELAVLAGRPGAVRAAASACARNVVGLVVPCHRVVRKDGTLGGYYWGLPIKRWLLDHEAAR